MTMTQLLFYIQRHRTFLLLIVLGVFICWGYIMAIFDNSVLKVIYRNEGGYTWVKGDSGGETYIGISRVNWPSWGGWRYIDSAKPLKQGQILNNPELANKVKDFYEKNFWIPNHLDQITQQQEAIKIMDMAVNMGSYQAVKLVQKALNKRFNFEVPVDGKLGPITYTYINQCDTNKFLTALRDISVDFYKSLVVKNPKNKQFLSDWLQRALQ